MKIDLTLSLPTAQKNAIKTLFPALKAHLKKIARVYREATPEQRAQLLAHNPTLAAVVDLLED